MKEQINFEYMEWIEWFALIQFEKISYQPNLCEIGGVETNTELLSP